MDFTLPTDFDAIIIGTGNIINSTISSNIYK